jgi:hypothetical protein
MFLATTNKSKRLLHLSYIGKVGAAELERGRQDMIALLADLPAGLHLLADLGRMESMDIACVDEIGKMMELLEQHGVELIVRVIPDPSKDIGFNILSRFHYRHAPRAVNCKTIAEAARLLSL